MSELSGKYRQIMEELDNTIQDKETLKFVKNKFSDLSLLFIDIIDRITELTDSRIKTIEQKQQEIANKILSVETIVDGIESDIYEDENYEFEIVCPYCNYEFTADIEDEAKDEIQCPECHNLIELDWNNAEGESSCSSNCSHCVSQCRVAEEEEKYQPEKPEKQEDDDEDM